MTAAYSGILHVTKESSRPTLRDDTTRLKYGATHVVEWLQPIFCNLVTRVRTQGKHSSSDTWAGYSGCHLCIHSQLKFNSQTNILSKTTYIYFSLSDHSKHWTTKNNHMLLFENMLFLSWEWMYTKQSCVVVWEHVAFELGMDVQLAPWIPCPRVRIWMFSLGSNPGHKVTKKGV